MARRTHRWLALVGAASLVLAGCSAAPGGTPGPAVDAGSTWPAAGPATSPPAASAPAAAPSATAATARYVFPVGGAPVSYHRTHAGYPATDIFADCGAPVRAVTDGVVLEVSRVDRFDPARPDGATKGGRFVSLLGDDGVRYYGSHLIEVAAGIEAGARVRAGATLGRVGHTGDASNVCHLHFGLSPRCAGTADWWIRRGVVWPWPFLDAWRRGVHRSPAVAVTGWHRAHGCPGRPD